MGPGGRGERSPIGDRCWRRSTWSSTWPGTVRAQIRRFRPLAEGLIRLVEACDRAGGLRFVHISVPTATEGIETRLPYMVRKREVDAAVSRSQLAYSIIRPTMLFGPGRQAPHRDDADRPSMAPAANLRRRSLPLEPDRRDRSRAHRTSGSRLRRRAIVEAGGPKVWEYRDLCDRSVRIPGTAPQVPPDEPVRRARRRPPARERRVRRCSTPTRWNGWCRTGWGSRATRGWTHPFDR